MVTKVLLDSFYTDCGYQINLKEKIEESGFEVFESDYIRYQNENFNKLSFLKDEEILVYGSIQFVEDAMKYFPKAISFYNPRDYNVSSYMSKIQNEYFVNSNVMFIPYGMFMSQFKDLLTGFDHKIFVRSDKGNKSFSGNIVTAENIDTVFKFSSLEHDSFLVLSDVVDIKEEYRFAIVGNKVISGCQYYKHGELCLSEDYPDNALKQAQEIASLPQEQLPDDVFVCDIGKVGNKYKVVEFNAFSTADLYLCDVTNVFQEVEKYLTKTL